MLGHGLDVLLPLLLDGPLEREDLGLEGLELLRDLVAVRRRPLVGDLDALVRGQGQLGLTLLHQETC